MKALEDRVILERIKEDDNITTPSGFIIQNTEVDEKNEAIVVATGPGFMTPSGVRMEVPVKVGDKVIYNPMAVRDMEYEGKEYLVSFYKDLVAIIEEA